MGSKRRHEARLFNKWSSKEEKDGDTHPVVTLHVILEQHLTFPSFSGICKSMEQHFSFPKKIVDENFRATTRHWASNSSKYPTKDLLKCISGGKEKEKWRICRRNLGLLPVCYEGLLSFAVTHRPGSCVFLFFAY